jgi:hypothetical protein
MILLVIITWTGIVKLDKGQKTVSGIIGYTGAY